MKLARWLLPLVSLAIVLLVTWWDLGGARQGPGPLHPAHARVAELAQADHCDACHRRGAGVDAAACTRCHAAIGAQQASRQGLHGKLAPADLQRCGTCHGEHHGDAVALIAPHAFARAGILDADAYDHRDVAFQLRGAHAALACERCHPQARASEPPAGGRFLGASQRCTSCHADPHRQAYGDDCASCHGQEQPWAAVPLFPHEVFPLDAAHAKVACAACHADGTEHAVAALRQAKLPARTCAECHANPHGAPDVPATALRLSRAQDCARCHEATTWASARRTPAEHAVFGFVLRGAHATAACAACHGDAKVPMRWRGAAPELAACGACHDQPHGAICSPRPRPRWGRPRAVVGAIGMPIRTSAPGRCRLHSIAPPAFLWRCRMRRSPVRSAMRAKAAPRGFRGVLPRIAVPAIAMCMAGSSRRTSATRSARPATTRRPSVRRGSAPKRTRRRRSR